MKVPSGAGQRIIMNYVGSEDGFLISENFIAKTGSGDYHREMNISHIVDFWAKVVEKLPDKSAILIDNALYHNMKSPETKKPNSNAKKDDIKKWLKQHKIYYDQEMLKDELLLLVKKSGIQEEYLTENMARETGKDIIVLRIPIAHSELNPTENIQHRIKTYVADRNTQHRKGFNIHKVQELLQEAINSITPKDWKAAFKKVPKIEDKFWQKDHLLDLEPVAEPLINPLDESEDSDDEALHEAESGIEYSSCSENSVDSFSDEY